MTQKSSFPSPAYNEVWDDEIFYTKISTSVTRMRLTFNSAPDIVTDLAVDSLGKAHTVLERWDGNDKEIWYLTNRDGGWRQEKLTNDLTEDQGASLAVNSGQVFVAWYKTDPGVWDLEIYFRQKRFGEPWATTERLTNNSTHDSNPSVSAFKGKAQLVYVKSNPYDIADIVFKWQY